MRVRAFAKDEYYFKLRPIVTWEEKGFVSNLVEMTVHAGTHIDSPHHFFRHMPGVEQIPLDAMIGEAIVMDLTFKGTANAASCPRISNAPSAPCARRASRSSRTRCSFSGPTGHGDT